MATRKKVKVETCPCRFKTRAQARAAVKKLRKQLVDHFDVLIEDVKKSGDAGYCGELKSMGGTWQILVYSDEYRVTFSHFAIPAITAKGTCIETMLFQLQLWVRQHLDALCSDITSSCEGVEVLK